MKYDKPLNIILYVVSHFPTIGGREVVVHYIAKWLKRLGHNPRIVGPAGWIKKRKYKFEYPVHRWPTLRGMNFEQISQLNLYLDTKIWKTDIIHAHSTYPNAYNVSQLRSLRNMPLVVTPHGRDIQVIPEINYGMRMNPDLNVKINRAVARANICTAISKDIVNSIMDAGAAREKIAYIANGVDLERFDKDYGVVIRAQYGLPVDALIILSVASYHIKRGYENLINVFSRVQAELNNAYLLIVGRDTEVLNDQINLLGLHDNVRLLGQIQPPFFCDDKDMLASLYRQSDIYVNASIATGAEGLSLALLDAMGAGLPVIATNISGNKDVIIKGVNGYLVEPENRESMANLIISVLRDREKANQLGAASRKLAEQYSWEHITKQYLDLYLKLTNT